MFGPDHEQVIPNIGKAYDDDQPLPAKRSNSTSSMEEYLVIQSIVTAEHPEVSVIKQKAAISNLQMEYDKGMCLNKLMQQKNIFLQRVSIFTVRRKLIILCKKNGPLDHYCDFGD